MKKKWWAGIGALLIIVIGVFIYLYFFHGDAFPMLADEGPDVEQTANDNDDQVPMKTGVEEVVTYLLYGRDTALDEKSVQLNENDVEQRVETDLVLIATVDPKDQTVNISFIPPNTVIEDNTILKDLYNDKGIEGLCSGVEALTQKKINYHLGVDYASFIQLVNVFNGIEVKLDETIELNKYGLTIHPGINKLNGEETLKLLRLKQASTTAVERIERQKSVLTAIYQRLLDIKDLSQFQDVTETVLNIREKLETDIQSDQILNEFKFLSEGIDQFNVDILAGELVNGQWIPEK